MDAVALQHIKKSYTSYSSEIVLTGQTRQSRTRQVLRDLSVCFPIGQLTVIVGRSGCGKSTLLKLLAGKEQPDAGQIATQFNLNENASDIITGIILFFILGCEFFIHYQVELRKREKEAAKA